MFEDSWFLMVYASGSWQVAGGSSKVSGFKMFFVNLSGFEDSSLAYFKLQGNYMLDLTKTG